MTRRGKITLAVLVVGSLLGLIAATNAWFVSVNHTPPGAISSALVRYLPEAGARSFKSMLDFGTLISGSGVDPDGVPLVLPGDRLLSSSTVNAAGTQTVRTSVARTFETGETAGTVIYWEVREYDGVTLTRKQRDLMEKHPAVTTWYPLEGGAAISPPAINPTLYDIVTTSHDTVTNGTHSTGYPSTSTETVVTTTYTARAAGTPSYKQVVVSSFTVIHETAAITPAEQAALWTEPPPAQYIKAVETVLSVRDLDKPALKDLPTRTYLLIERYGSGLPQTASGASTAIPLKVGNLSTVASRLRVGLVAYLTLQDGSTVPLTIRGPEAGTGNYYLGTVGSKGKFVELLVFHPYSAGNGYRWDKVTDASESPTRWALWDLKLGDSAVIPALPTPTPSTSPAAEPPASPAPEVEPVLYTVTDLLGIVSRRPDTSAVAEADFEQQFNELYCDDIPIITVHFNYYARQNDYMEWNEFYSQSITLDMPK